MTNARAAYTEASVATASPARLLVMLYERLVLDIQRGLEAQQRGDHQETHRLYGFLHRQLVMANIRKDATITDECLTLVTDLCETWRQAALESVAGPARTA